MSDIQVVRDEDEYEHLLLEAIVEACKLSGSGIKYPLLEQLTHLLVRHNHPLIVCAGREEMK